MGFASNQAFNKVLFLLMSAILLVSCAGTEKIKKLPVKADIKPEPRESLLNWHNVTHKSYYGLKGAVKSLIIEPVVTPADSEQEVSDGWELLFNRQGRLISKSSLNEKPVLRTAYTYSESGDLKFVSSYKADQLWRTSNFIYKGDQLTKIEFADKTTNEHLLAKLARQPVADGWFTIEKMVSSPDLPTYSQYLNDSSLVWSSKGDINNGLGELYYIRTVDGVTSSDVLNSGTDNMQGRGGYRYLYRDDGLLKSVESYNAHKNRLFHRTSYQYNDIGLVVSENRKVLDSSPFNQVLDESVSYEYLQIDDRGNWLQRRVNVKTGYQKQSYLETRKIDYY